MYIVKSIGAILAGFITVVVLNTGTDYLMQALGIFPPLSQGAPYDAWMLAFALAYRCVEIVAGGYVTALLAPDRPMRHVIILGCLGILGGIAGIVTGWNLSAHWYPIALAVLAFPSTYLGGWLYKKRTSSFPR
jgi:hypothetical protein